MTWANFLTSLRLVAAPLCAWTDIGGHWPAACAVFFFAVATDVLDGMLARRFDQVSSFGGLFDHGTDAIFVTVTLAGQCPPLPGARQRARPLRLCHAGGRV